MRRLILLLAAIVVVLVPASPAAAVVFGSPDGTAHPNVGGLVSPTQYPDGTSRLPQANSLSSLRAGQAFTSVGYGAYEVTNGPGGHQYLYDDVRMRSTGSLNAVNKSWLRISGNPATGDGGTCYGDSGGPNFLGTTDIVAAITITGDAICRATNVDYRLDTPSARAFLGQYVTLP